VQIPVETDPRQRGDHGTQAAAEVLHPLQPLTRDEISVVSAVVRAEMAELGETIRFETIELNEPAKAVVRGFEPGDPLAREARVNIYRTGDIGVWRMVVSITDRKVLAKKFLPEARPMIQLEEFLEIEAVVKRDPAFIAGCAKRGITDMSLICVDPWSAGNFGVEGEEGRHLSHVFCWVKSSPHDNLYAHPIEGLNPVVDIKKMEVIRVDDYGITPVPKTDYNYDREFVTGTRNDLRAINIEQPDGVSFEMEGAPSGGTTGLC
jgi:primary-amine oxidase